MILPESELQRCRALVASAFPRFGSWEFVNAPHRDYVGFTIWGRYRSGSERQAPVFFVTFDRPKEQWVGHLTVGKHSYFWSSADFGDASLLYTDRCATLEEAIAALKRRIAAVFADWMASDAEPRG